MRNRWSLAIRLELAEARVYIRMKTIILRRRATEVTHIVWHNRLENLLVEILNGLVGVFGIDFCHIVLHRFHEALVLLFIQLTTCAPLEIGIKKTIQHGLVLWVKKLGLGVCSGSYVRH